MGKEREISELLPAAGGPNGRKTPNLPDIPPTEDEDDGKGKATKVATPPPTYTSPPEDDFDELTKRFEALKKR